MAHGDRLIGKIALVSGNAEAQIVSVNPAQRQFSQNRIVSENNFQAVLSKTPDNEGRSTCPNCS